MIEFEYVVRSVGERTEDICVELIKLQQQPDEKITIIREPTHAKAIERTFAIGLKGMSDWVVAVDADVLLLPGSATQIRKELVSCKENVFVVNSAVYDKIYSMKRWAGVHVYRRAMLEELYDVFREIKNKPNLKIETAAIKELQKKNKQPLFSKIIVGTHDFKQFYKDIYRKAYLNTIRNPGNIKRAKNNWSRKSSFDADYLVMLKAMEDALAEGRRISNSLSDFNSAELADRIDALCLTEKPPLLWEEYVNDCLTTTMDSEIRSNAKNSSFNDYYESQTLNDKFKSIILRWIPDTLHERYLYLKSNIVRKVNNDST